MVYKLADFGGLPEELAGSGSRGLYNQAVATWSKPVVWNPTDAAPPLATRYKGEGGVYVFLRDHANQKDRCRITYVGKALDFSTRLTRRHKMFDTLVSARGRTLVSVATFQFAGIRVDDANRDAVLNHLEHLYIWALWPFLENASKLLTLPGLGQTAHKRVIPWQIENVGYRFHGLMPRQIVYPWMMVSLGTDRSSRLPRLSPADLTSGEAEEQPTMVASEAAA